MTSLWPTLSAVFSVFLLGLIGFAAQKRKIITPSGTSELARLLVDFILPATLFNAMFSQYEKGSGWQVGHSIIAQLSLFSFGCITAVVLYKLFDRKSPLGTVMVLSSLQNNVYVPLPIALAVLSVADAKRAEFIIGSFVMCFTPLLWSVGIILLGASRKGSGLWKQLSTGLNPPFLAAVSGLLLKILFLRFGWEMPTLITNVMKMAGSATTPLAMVVLGALIAEYKWTRDTNWRPVIISATVKLVLVPAAAFTAFRFLPKLDPIFVFVAMLQASCPPATNISVAAKRFNTSTDLIAVTIFVTYLLSVITIPLWLSLL